MDKFHRLTIVAETVDGKKGYVRCVCDCGNITDVTESNLKCGYVKSCGCLKREKSSTNGKNNTVHGEASPAGRTRTYRSWEGARSRCYNPNATGYAGYGGRGIGMCNEWVSFQQFKADMGERPPGKSLERVDNNRDYCPENCIWASLKAQASNKRNNVVVSYNGKTMTLMQLAETTNIPYQRLSERIVRNKWSVDRAVTEPVDTAKINNAYKLKMANQRSTYICQQPQS